MHIQVQIQVTWHVSTWYHDLCLNAIFVHLSEKTTSVGVWDAHCILILFGFYRYLNNNTKMKLTRWGVLSLLKFPRKSLLSFTRVLTTRLVDKAPRQTDQLSRPAQESKVISVWSLPDRRCRLGGIALICTVGLPSFYHTLGIVLKNKLTKLGRCDRETIELANSSWMIVLLGLQGEKVNK